MEGRWYPIEPSPKSPVFPNSVRVVCSRPERSCKEELTHLASERTEPVRETLTYRVEEWTKWGTPAGKLIASRHDGGVASEIRVSLSGLVAEKVRIENAVETHWRLE